MPQPQFAPIQFRRHGDGMVDIQEHIFEPFFTTEPEGKGKARGLSTVYGIVKQAGGYVPVDSDPRAGATFDLSLRRTYEAIEAPAAPAREKPLEPRALRRKAREVLDQPRVSTTDEEAE